MPELKTAPLGHIPIPYNFAYADTAAREAATGLIPSDLGKFARQLDNNTIWMLTDDDPVTWVQVGGPPGVGVGDVVGPGSSTDNAVVRFDSTTGKLIQSSTVTIDNDGALTVPEIAAPATPASGQVSVYAKSDGKLYIKDDAGTETDLTAGANLLGNVIDETGAPLTLDASHNGAVVLVDDDVTVPSGLSVGFNVMLIQTGASPVEILESSTTVNNRQGHVHIADQFGAVTLISYASNVFVLGGDTDT